MLAIYSEARPQSMRPSSRSLAYKVFETYSGAGIVCGSVVAIGNQYHWQIIGVAAVCLVETLLVVALVIELRRRHRAERLRLESEDRAGRSADEARESDARFLLIANAAPVLIWISGLDKLCTFFNQPWLDFTGRTFEQEIGNGWADGVHPEDLATCIQTYNESFDARRPFTMDYRLRRHDGEYRWVSDHGIPHYDGHGTFLGYIGSCVDITDRKFSEERLRQALAELNKVKERLDNENSYLRHEMKVLHAHQDIVGQSRAAAASPGGGGKGCRHGFFGPSAGRNRDGQGADREGDSQPEHATRQDDGVRQLCRDSGNFD